MTDLHGSPTTESWVNVRRHVLSSGLGHGETVVNFTLSRRRGKLIVDESDEEIDSYPNLLRPTDPQHPCSSVGPSYNRDTLEYPRPETILPSSDYEPTGNHGGQASGSGENHGSERVRVPEQEGDDEESSSEPSQPSKKRNLGHKMEADSYPIDYLKCATTHTDLLKLRSLYNIIEDVLLAILGKGDVHSRPPKGYVTLHLDSFNLGARLPLQPYFARILGGMHLAPGQLHPNGWRVLSTLFILCERCELREPSLVEVNYLYQLRSSPKEVGWYYFMSSSAKRKPFVGCHFSYSWGLIKQLEDVPLLKVETALVNASHCQDLLSPTNLLGSGLVDVVAGMHNKILSAMSRKCARGSGDSRNAPTPQKKNSVGPSKTLVPALPPPPPQKNDGEKFCDKSPEVSTQSRDRALPLPPRD
ncbi:uncharacterized protein LOC112099112 [Citrus clementina]|uniref:uncharacterized protein LOC112099112 n=1 Tax=Citrus clementina TaxID=85681 RepID=UPI000CED601F|nr:uncharacterized protein LOC112099112 [Citrus x clementina]